MTENILLTNKHILVCLDYKSELLSDKEYDKEYEYIKKNFCGIVLTDTSDLDNYTDDTIIYICGNIEHCQLKNKKINVIKELSYNYNSDDYHLISLGQVPINVHNVGLYFRNLFDSEKDYFNLIKQEHKFQKLTESNKPSNAFRKGIYITKVQKDNDNLKFNLLRCSSNLDGPTDNFRETDNEIINTVNDISQHFFEEKVELNHVLAQIYENKKEVSFYTYIMMFINYIWLFLFKKPYFNIKNTEKKAKIKAHSDKTKDMPANATMAFCTFYDFSKKLIKKSKYDSFDYCYNNTSVLTQLHFRLKNMVTDKKYVKQFSVTLYPNSVFLIPLSTNRLYTHEIKPSILPIDKIPTRLGYVIRCSNTQAIFKDGQTYIDNNNVYHKLIKYNDDDVTKLRELYFKENTTIEHIDYGKVYFSMNNGDYKKPYY